MVFPVNQPGVHPANALAFAGITLSPEAKSGYTNKETAPGDKVLIIPATELRKMREHAEREYPKQCCGLLLGWRRDHDKHALRAQACRNAAPAPAESFLVAPQELIEWQRCGREQQFEILGFYHSHPDQPANPSEQDVSLACWTNCSYVVLSVEDGVLTVLRSFTPAMEAGKATLLEEPVKIEREIAQPDAVPA
jgi:proteasome lid subunit RPN8/RPN11